MDAGRLEERDEIVDGEVAIGATVSLARARGSVAEDLLARVRCITSTSTVGVTTNITVGMANIIFVPGVEFVVGKSPKSLTPEDNAVFKRETNTLQEKGILKTTKMFQMGVFAECHVQTSHTEREVL